MYVHVRTRTSTLYFVLKRKLERHIHVMRDEKEGRKNQARSNKLQGKATQHTHMYMYVYMHACSYSVHVMYM